MTVERSARGMHKNISGARGEVSRPRRQEGHKRPASCPSNQHTAKPPRPIPRSHILCSDMIFPCFDARERDKVGAPRFVFLAVYLEGKRHLFSLERCPWPPAPVQSDGRTKPSWLRRRTQNERGKSVLRTANGSSPSDQIKLFTPQSALSVEAMPVPPLLWLTDCQR